jgi:hypothetical protein
LPREMSGLLMAALRAADMGYGRLRRMLDSRPDFGDRGHDVSFLLCGEPTLPSFSTTVHLLGGAGHAGHIDPSLFFHTVNTDPTSHRIRLDIDPLFLRRSVELTNKVLVDQCVKGSIVYVVIVTVSILDAKCHDSSLPSPIIVSAITVPSGNRWIPALFRPIEFHGLRSLSTSRADGCQGMGQEKKVDSPNAGVYIQNNNRKGGPPCSRRYLFRSISRSTATKY